MTIRTYIDPFGDRVEFVPTGYIAVTDRAITAPDLETLLGEIYGDLYTPTAPAEVRQHQRTAIVAEFGVESLDPSSAETLLVSMSQAELIYCGALT